MSAQILAQGRYIADHIAPVGTEARQARERILLAVAEGSPEQVIQAVDEARRPFYERRDGPHGVMAPGVLAISNDWLAHVRADQEVVEAVAGLAA